MQQFSSTAAKQNFGQLLKASAQGPVAIEKHGKVQAILSSPAAFAQAAEKGAPAASRQLARAQQALVEKDRLVRHQRIALDLVTLAAGRRERLVAQARAEVQRWREQRLSSADYIDRWAQILDLPARGMAEAITSDLDGWGTALRQNSPWVGVHA